MNASSPSPPPRHHRYHSSLIASSNDSSRQSSLQQVWADDYYSDDQTNLDILASPKPAALTERPFPRSIPLSFEEESAVPRQTRTHQRSLTALLPSFRSPQRSPERSPKKETAAFAFMPTLTGDKDCEIRIGEKAKGLSGWFNGSSSPVAVGIPSSTDEFEDVEMSPQPNNPSPEPPTSRERSQTTTSMASTITTKPAPTTSRFSFFSRPTTTTAKSVQLPQDLTSDLLTLDIQHALYPTPQSTTFSPAAFTNLQVAAESLLSRMQAAYKSRSLELYELRSEQAVQSDELEEASTRSDALKMQLEDMAGMVAEKDEELKRLREELALERAQRERERIARVRSIEMVRYGAHAQHMQILTPPASRQGHRRSDVSFESDLDGDEMNCSEMDGDVESVFSRSLSPAFTDVSSIMQYPSSVPTPEIFEAKVVSMRAATLDAQVQKETRKPKMVRQRSTYERLMGRVLDVGREEEEEEAAAVVNEGCANCRGGSAVVAWDTVSLLKVENRGLKERVGELDKAMDSALDCVAGFGLRE